ncbi:MAG: hypothetical protein WCV90_02745 [Candidatus Woesearchaeota archaeon]
MKFIAATKEGVRSLFNETLQEMPLEERLGWIEKTVQHPQDKKLRSKVTYLPLDGEYSLNGKNIFLLRGFEGGLLHSMAVWDVESEILIPGKIKRDCPYEQEQLILERDRAYLCSASIFDTEYRCRCVVPLLAGFSRPDQNTRDNLNYEIAKALIRGMVNHEIDNYTMRDYLVIASKSRLESSKQILEEFS